MKTFPLTLHDATRTERFGDIVHFIGADETGAFGVQARHENMVAVLRYGLARFLDSAGRWRYLALPGGILRFSDNALTVIASRCFVGGERDAITARLAAEMAREDSELHASKTTLAGIERTLMRYLNEMSAQTGRGAAR